MLLEFLFLFFKVTVIGMTCELRDNGENGINSWWAVSIFLGKYADSAVKLFGDKLVKENGMAGMNGVRLGL